MGCCEILLLAHSRCKPSRKLARARMHSIGERASSLILAESGLTSQPSQPCLTAPRPLSISLEVTLSLSSWHCGLQTVIIFILNSFLLTADLSCCVKRLPRRSRYGTLHLCLTCVISGHKALGEVPWSWGRPAVPLDHVKAVAVFPSFLLKLL